MPFINSNLYGTKGAINGSFIMFGGKSDVVVMIPFTLVHDDPEHAYEEEFFARFAAAAGWQPGR